MVAMLSRFITNSSRNLHLLSRSFSPHFSIHSRVSPTLPLSNPPKFGVTHLISRHFSTNNNNNNNDGDDGKNPTWKIAPENEDSGAVFGASHENIEQVPIWKLGSENEKLGSVFGSSNNGGGNLSGFGDGGVDDWLGAKGEFKPWNLEEGKKVEVEDVFDVGVVNQTEEGSNEVELEKEKKVEDDLELQKEEEELMNVLKGPDRAFGDLVAASGITDDMLDSLIALKDFKDIQGLPPLTEIEDQRYENSLKKSSRYEMELQKQEEIARSRVRQVDEKGRAYGTGRRKCSIARVWIEPGEGKFLVNDKDFDVYFPQLDHRAALLRPFSETQTLGLWDVKCTVKGGGTSGQVGAIRLGVSRALQNWEPGLRPPLREAGFLTRDPRVVERKKPGKAKARKSFQWVKR